MHKKGVSTGANTPDESIQGRGEYALDEIQNSIFLPQLKNTLFDNNKIFYPFTFCYVPAAEFYLGVKDILLLILPPLKLESAPDEKILHTPLCITKCIILFTNIIFLRKPHKVWHKL